MAQDGKSSVKDFKQVLRVVAETAELWYDPQLQRRYTLDALMKLVDASAGLLFIWGDCLLGGSNPCVSLVHSGLDDAQAGRITNYLQTGAPADPALPKLADLVAPVVVQTRRDLISDKAWYASDYYKDFRSSLGLDDTIYAKISVPNKIIAIALLRKTDAEPFTSQHAHMVDMALSQMAWPFQPEDVPVDPRLSALQPRLKKVMQHLLEGDSEKQVAAKLGLSKHTVHEYVKMLYQQLGVNSRGELLSQWVGRV